MNEKCVKGVKFMVGGRNASIDFFRCLLMVGIVAQHVVGQSTYVRHGVDFLTNVMLNCVERCLTHRL